MNNQTLSPLDEAKAAAVRLKGGKRLSTTELVIIDLMHEDENYQMYLDENKQIGYKKREGVA